MYVCACAGNLCSSLCAATPTEYVQAICLYVFVLFFLVGERGQSPRGSVAPRHLGSKGSLVGVGR